MNRKGLLISFEGPDGSGKSTQLRLLKQALRKEGHRVFVTRQPGGTKIGKVLRSLLLKRSNVHLSERAELFLYLADRAQHVHEVIAPAVKSGSIVLVDRYMDSTWVYQGAGRGFPIDLIEKCNRFAVAGFVPDMTLVFDVSAQKGLSRVAKGRSKTDRMEAQSLAFHRRVSQGFRRLRRRFGRRVVLVNANDSIERIRQTVRDLIRERFGL